MEQDPGAGFEAVYDSGTSGLVGTVAVAIHDNVSSVVFGPTTANIVELVVAGQPTGSYRANLTAPSTLGQYAIVWSDDGSFDPGTGAIEDLLVAVSELDLPSLGGAVANILCSAWTTAADVVDCCDAALDSGGALLDSAIVAASEILYLASGRQYPGACSRTVRPCRLDSCHCGYQVLSRGHLVNWDAGCWGGFDCGCQPLSRLPLPGYVRDVTEVKIDGSVLDEDDYFVYDRKWLTRKNGSRWPRCQSLDLDDTEAGTFSVTYAYGKAPPVAGQLAAAQLACELAKSCITDGDFECAIPNGVTRIIRQGITIERPFLVRNKEGIWATGMGQVDFFLNAVNPSGLSRRGIFWSPSSRHRYPRSSPV